MPPLIPVRSRVIQLHAVQAEFRASAALYRGFVGGRGSGKSWVGAYDLIRRAKRGRTYLVASPTGPMLEDTTLPTFRERAQALGVWGEYRAHPYPTVTLTTGATVRFRTAIDPERMRGPNLSGVWLDEASLMDEEAYRISIAALRECGEQGWLSATYTPKGPSHWTYARFASGLPDTEEFRAPTRANPFNPPGFEDTLRRQYGDTQFARQELDGLYVSIEGAEFPAEWFDWPGFWLDTWPDHLHWKAYYLDPSKGASDVADYQAHVRAALCVIDGRNTIVLDAVAEREDVTAMTRRAVKGVRDWPVHACGVEENGTMGFLMPAFHQVQKDLGVIQPWQPIVHRTPKLQRIRRVGVYLSLRQVRIIDSRGGRLLRAQLGDFPLGEHDDGPDAAAGAIDLLEQLAAGGR